MVVTKSHGTPGLASRHTSVPRHTVWEPLIYRLLQSQLTLTSSLQSSDAQSSKVCLQVTGEKPMMSHRIQIEVG